MELIAARLTRIDADARRRIGSMSGSSSSCSVRLDKDAALGGSLGFVCDDIDAASVVEVPAGSTPLPAQRGPADCVTIVGPASAMFLPSWKPRLQGGFGLHRRRGRSRHRPARLAEADEKRPDRVGLVA